MAARIRRILFASDYSPASRKAFATALSLAKANGAALTIVHVIVPFVPIAPDQYVSAQTWNDIERDTRRVGQRELHKLTARAKAAGVRAVGRLLEGNPAEQIERATRAERADLLIVGTHGRTGLARFFIGSVAGRLVATASCPVITVRGR